MDWLIANKEWFLSGLGVTIISIVVGLLTKNKSGKNIKQNQKSGSHSNNIQVGGNINNEQK